jgi:hypothetical protein
MEQHAGTRPERLRHIGRDGVLIVLGAVLAYVGEEWRDARHRRERVDTALNSIRDELKANAALVTKARTRHLYLIDTLGKLAAAHQLPSVSIAYNGIWSPAPVTSVAWQTAHETGVLADIPLSTVLSLAPVYERQDRYRVLTDAMMVSIETDTRHSGMEAVLRDRFAEFIPIDVDFSNREKVLLSEYDAALRRLNDIH